MPQRCQQGSARARVLLAAVHSSFPPPRSRKASRQSSAIPSAAQVQGQPTAPLLQAGAACSSLLGTLLALFSTVPDIQFSHFITEFWAGGPKRCDVQRGLARRPWGGSGCRHAGRFTSKPLAQRRTKDQGAKENTSRWVGRQSSCPESRGGGGDRPSPWAARRVQNKGRAYARKRWGAIAYLPSLMGIMRHTTASAAPSHTCGGERAFGEGGPQDAATGGVARKPPLALVPAMVGQPGAAAANFAG